MKNSKHTPGPWAVNGWSVTIGNWSISTAMPRATIEESDANARLIAAAPELLEALNWALKNLEEIALPEFEKQGRVTSINNAIEKARAAIAKAEGR